MPSSMENWHDDLKKLPAHLECLPSEGRSQRYGIGGQQRGAGRERGGRRGEEGERGSDLFIAEQHPRPRPLGACTAMHVSKRSKRRRLRAQDLTRHSVTQSAPFTA